MHLSTLSLLRLISHLCHSFLHLLYTEISFSFIALSWIRIWFCTLDIEETVSSASGFQRSVPFCPRPTIPYTRNDNRIVLRTALILYGKNDRPVNSEKRDIYGLFRCFHALQHIEKINFFSPHLVCEFHPQNVNIRIFIHILWINCG